MCPDICGPSSLGGNCRRPKPGRRVHPGANGDFTYDDGVFQRLPAVSHQGSLRRMPPGREASGAQFSRATLTWRAGQRRDVLVFRYLPYLGHGRCPRDGISPRRAFWSSDRASPWFQ